MSCLLDALRRHLNKILKDLVLGDSELTPNFVALELLSGMRTEAK